MGRKKKNKYRIKSPGITITLSLLTEYSKNMSDTEIIRAILIHFRYWTILENFDKGKRPIELIRVKEHKDVEGES